MNRATALFSCVALAACASPYETQVEPIFVRSCAAVECHADASFESGLTLAEGEGYDAIVGVPSVQSDLNLVEPGDPDASYLWHKINGTHAEFDNSPEPTGAMPSEDTTLPAGDLATVRDWILDGAR